MTFVQVGKFVAGLVALDWVQNGTAAAHSTYMRAMKHHRESTNRDEIPSAHLLAHIYASSAFAFMFGGIAKRRICCAEAHFARTGDIEYLRPITVSEYTVFRRPDKYNMWPLGQTSWRDWDARKYK